MSARWDALLGAQLGALLGAQLGAQLDALLGTLLGEKAASGRRFCIRAAWGRETRRAAQ